MPHFLLLSKWPAPCVYAARAKPDGAKLLFAFVFCKLEYMSILFQPHQEYTIFLRTYRLSKSDYWLKGSLSTHSVFMVELLGTAPRSIHPLLTLTNYILTCVLNTVHAPSQSFLSVI